MATTTATSSGLRDYVGTIRRRYVYVLAIAPPILLVSIFLAFWLKPLYQATVTISLQASNVVKDVVATTVTTDTEEQIVMVRDRVLTPDNLTQLVRDVDPYPQNSTWTADQKAQRTLGAVSIEKVDPVTFQPTSDPSDAFSLHYDNPDRRRSAAVADRLAQLFLTYNQRQRAQTARDTATFLQQQATSITGEISSVDAELARFKTTVGDALPELRDQNQGEIDRAEHDLDSLQQEILAAQGKESELSVALGQMSPNLITQSGDLTDVATVRALLAEAEERYTPEHPEVKRLKRALQALMAQNAGGAQGGTATSINNPQYVMMAAELASTRRDLAALQAQAAKEQQRIDSFSELLRRTPAVERQESDILRRRQSLQTEYQQIEDRLQSAQEAQSFEAQQRGDRFVLLKAADVPGSPISPNRKGIIAIGLLLGLGLAGGAIALAETVDTHIRNIGDIPESGEAPLLASIPIIRNQRDRVNRRIVICAGGLAYALAVIAVGNVVAQALHHH